MCTRRLHVHDDIGGKLLLMVKSRHVGTTSLPKPVDPAASLATSFFSSSESAGASCFSWSGSDRDFRVSSSGSDGASRVSCPGSGGVFRAFSLESDGAFSVSSSRSNGASRVCCPGSGGAFYISCFCSYDTGCYSSSSSCTSSCRAPLLPTGSSPSIFTPESLSPTPPGLSIHCTACRFAFNCKRASQGPHWPVVAIPIAWTVLRVMSLLECASTRYTTIKSCAIVAAARAAP